MLWFMDSCQQRALDLSTKISNFRSLERVQWPFGRSCFHCLILSLDASSAHFRQSRNLRSYDLFSEGKLDQQGILQGDAVELRVRTSPFLNAVLDLTFLTFAGDTTSFATESNTCPLERRLASVDTRYFSKINTVIQRIAPQPCSLAERPQGCYISRICLD